MGILKVGQNYYPDNEVTRNVVRDLQGLCDSNPLPCLWNHPTGAAAQMLFLLSVSTHRDLADPKHSESIQRQWDKSCSLAFLHLSSRAILHINSPHFP